MKTILLLFLLFLDQTALGQTEKLTVVPGTKCSLIPPDGFIAATNFSGFQNAETGASIMITELPASYQSVVDGFTSEGLKSRGMTLVSKQTIDFINSKATLFIVTQPANGTTYIKQMVIFGDSTYTVLVNGIYPEASKEIEEKIKESLLSTIYDASQNENPLQAATFTVDVTGTEFTLIKYMSGILLYSTDGKIPTEKPSLMVGNSIAKVAYKNQKEFAEERLKKLPRGETNVIKEIGPITIDNLKGFEIVADGKTNYDEAELVYQVILFSDIGDYYIIVGQAKEDYAKNLDSFKKIAKTFKRK